MGGGVVCGVCVWWWCGGGRGREGGRVCVCGRDGRGGVRRGEGKQDFYCLFGHGFSRPCVGTVVKVSTDVIVVILFERFCFFVYDDIDHCNKSFWKIRIGIFHVIKRMAFIQPKLVALKRDELPERVAP